MSHLNQQVQWSRRGDLLLFILDIVCVCVNGSNNVQVVLKSVCVNGSNDMQVVLKSPPNFE